MCECDDGLRLAIAFFGGNVGSCERHARGNEIGVERERATKKGAVLLLGGAGICNGADGGHERPRTFRVFFDGSAAVAFGALSGTDVNEFGASGEEFEGMVISGDVYSRRAGGGGEALDENTVTSGKFNAIEKVDGWGEADAASFDELAEVAGGITLGQAAENFRAIEGIRLGEGARAQEGEEQGQKRGSRCHGECVWYSWRRSGKQ